MFSWIPVAERAGVLKLPAPFTSNDIEEHEQRNGEHSGEYGKRNEHALVGE
jgi:hypothetical protein